MEFSQNINRTSSKSNLKARLAKALNNINSQSNPVAVQYEDDLMSDASNSLNDRVGRLQDKINNIQYSIEQGKNYQIEEYEAKVVHLEDRFDEVIDSTEKRFDILLNEQLNQIDTYLNRDRLTKQEMLRLKKQSIMDRQRELKSRFEAAE